jgi:hypothetical protein
VQMHYTAMLCHRALGHTQQAAREAALFRRFKADESAQAITAKPRRQSPEDNNERQPIHEHDSVRLPFGGAAGTKPAATTVATAAGPRGPAGTAPPARAARATRVTPPQPAAVEKAGARAPVAPSATSSSAAGAAGRPR